MKYEDNIVNNLIEKNNKITKKVEGIENLAVTDDLIGVVNRRGMYYKVVNSLYDEFVIANCDLDNLKNINDTFGYEESVNVLKEVNSLINSSLSDDSFLVRFGGDKFLIFFTGEDIIKCNEIVDLIKSDVELIGKQYYSSGNISDDQRKKLCLSVGLINYNSLDDKVKYVMYEDDIAYMYDETIGLLFDDLTRCIKFSDKKLHIDKRLSKGEIKNE